MIKAHGPFTLTLTLAALVAVACGDPGTTAPDEAATIPGPGFSIMADGQAAVYVTNCFAEPGSVFPALVWVSQTDVWVSDVEMVSSVCRTAPSGKHEERWAFRVLGDIPLPDEVVRGSTVDENGVPREYNVFFEGELVFHGVLVCVFDAPPHDFTFDGDFTTHPSGLSGGVCRFDGS